MNELIIKKEEIGFAGGLVAGTELPRVGTRFSIPGQGIDPTCHH